MAHRSATPRGQFVLTIVGSAVETMVWPSAEMSMPSSSAPMDTRTLSRFPAAGCGSAASPPAS